MLLNVLTLDHRVQHFMKSISYVTVVKFYVNLLFSTIHCNSHQSSTFSIYSNIIIIYSLSTPFIASFQLMHSLYDVDSQRNADLIAKKVKVKYSDVCKPITTIEQAIEQKSFHPPKITDYAIGNTDSMFTENLLIYLDIQSWHNRFCLHWIQLKIHLSDVALHECFLYCITNLILSECWS